MARHGSRIVAFTCMYVRTVHHRSRRYAGSCSRVVVATTRPGSVGRADLGGDIGVACLGISNPLPKESVAPGRDRMSRWPSSERNPLRLAVRAGSRLIHPTTSGLSAL